MLIFSFYDITTTLIEALNRCLKIDLSTKNIFQNLSLNSSSKAITQNTSQLNREYTVMTVDLRPKEFVPLITGSTVL